MRINYITLKGEQHPLCYNLTAAEAIEETFGSIEAWQKAMSGDSPKIKTVRQTLEALLLGGRAHCAEMDIPVPPAIRIPAAVIDVTSPETVKAIFSSLKTDTERKVEVVSKNAEPTPED